MLGALAGAAATVPMSWAMEVMHRALPGHEQYPLPPRQITEKLTEATGLRRDLSNSQRMWLSLAAHFGYGASVGALYETVAQRIPARPLTRGIIYGLIVWAGSYFGLLPALGIMRPATKHPARRNLVMILAHLVWGSALAIFQDLFENGSRGQHPSFLGGGDAPQKSGRHTPELARR
jgi:uncharacterized membrane protein YagU involved in acid resistance